MLCSGMDEDENHERGVGFLLSKDAVLDNDCWNGNRCLRGKSEPGST